jgi:hypothetical protein
VTNGWVEHQTASSASTGITLNKIQHITSNYLLGNRSGSNASPSEITFNQAVVDGDGVQNASFLAKTATTGVMFATTANPVATRYDVKPVTNAGGATSILETRSDGKINVKGLLIDGFATVDVASNKLSITTPGGIVAFDAIGSVLGSTTVNIRGNTTVTGTFSSSGNMNTNGTLAATGNLSTGGNFLATGTVGGTQGNFSTHVRTPLLKASGTESNPGDEDTAVGFIQGHWSLVGTSRLVATYADLAEYYEGDQEYEVGTVLVFGGDKEVTTTQLHMDRRVAGVVSNTAAYIMNEGCPGIKVCVALQGRVPVKVVGIVKKGDILVAAAKPGYAIVNNEPNAGTIIGKALAAKTDAAPGIVEVVVGRC